MCRERGLSVAQKGRNFHGNELEQGTVRAWSKDKYHLMQNEAKDSFVADCGIACLEAVEISCSKEEFIRNMAERGWNVIWQDSRKHITFQNEEGKKVRDSNLSKTFHLDISKKALANEFKRQAEDREQTEGSRGEPAAGWEHESAELERYYREVQDAAERAVRDNPHAEGYHQRAGVGHPTADGHDRNAGKNDSAVTGQHGAGHGTGGKGKTQHGRAVRERAIRERFADLAGTGAGAGMEEKGRAGRTGDEPDGTELFLADIRTQVRDSEFQRQAREAERSRPGIERERRTEEVEHRIVKEQELDRLIEDTERKKQEALSAQSGLQKLIVQKAEQMSQGSRRKWEILYQTKKAALQGYVGLLAAVCFVTTVLPVIRRRAFCGDVLAFFKELRKAVPVLSGHIHSAILSAAEIAGNVSNDLAAIILKRGLTVLLWAALIAAIGFGIHRFWRCCGEDIRKGIDAWNCSVSVMALLALVYFGDYVKRIIAVNLFGMWLLLDVLLILAGWYVWGCKKYRGFC